ncbi:MAG: T9SS type A sorting domain-containing protein, partial [Ignavibacteriales bacterium]|nr:T9SS type A sorting domain-containing protein [Ignavibacteriales bacterium]
GSQPDLHFTFPSVTSFDWTQYYIDWPVITDPEAKCLEVRLHVYSRFVGTVYWDDLTVEKLELPTLNMAGGFENALPSYWHKIEPGNAKLEWVTDQSRSMARSLKITKTATAEAAMWESDNMCDYWSPTHNKNVDILIGGYVKTEGINTNPANDDQKWWISYTFYNQAGTLIGETKLPIDQSTATSSGWIADTNGVGETILPEDAYRTIITFVGGKDATGTVWADDFILIGRGGAWAGQDWNTGVDLPEGWTCWLPPIGGNDGRLDAGFENTRLSSEAHSGQWSLKFDMPAGRRSQDGFVGTKRMLLNEGGGKLTNSPAGNMFQLNNVKAGDVLRISVWIKAANLVPDSAAKYPETWSVGFTPAFFKGNGNNDGYNNVGSQPDLHFTFPSVTSFDWTQYYIDWPVITDPEAKCLEVRLHVYSRFVGTVYWDDLTVKVIGNTTGIETNKIIPVKFAVEQNYPNPFNPSTTISYSLPENSYVTVKIYNMLGREVKTLISSQQNSGVYNVIWNGDTNSGEKVSSGAYIYRVEAGKFNQVRKMILLK